MGRSSSEVLGGILVLCIAAGASGQAPWVENGTLAPLPPITSVQVPSVAETGYLSVDTPQTDLSTALESVVESPTPRPLDGFLGYRFDDGSTDWIVGNGNQFGMFSLTTTHYQEPGVTHGFGADINLHFLSGPIQTDMPPRVYDFGLGYQHRDQLGVFAYDVAFSVVASSDFEGSAREGIRYPGHAVGFLTIAPATDLVFGLDYVDRGDFKLLPVGGLIVTPNSSVRLEAVFPRPRVVFRLTEEHELYVGGELGGGTWAIERIDYTEDLATYRDLRVCIGLQTTDADGHRTGVEIGYLFDRRLEYTSGVGDYSPNDTVMIRLGRTF